MQPVVYTVSWFAALIEPSVKETNYYSLLISARSRCRWTLIIRVTRIRSMSNNYYINTREPCEYVIIIIIKLLCVNNLQQYLVVWRWFCETYCICCARVCIFNYRHFYKNTRLVQISHKIEWMVYHFFLNFFLHWSNVFYLHTATITHWPKKRLVQTKWVFYFVEFVKRVE